MGTDNGAFELIRQLEERLLRADTRSAQTEVEALLADEFVEFTSSGRVLTRSMLLELLTREPAASRSLADFRATFLASDLILATYRATRTDMATGAIVQSLRSSLWKFSGDRWQVIFHQGTPAP